MNTKSNLDQTYWKNIVNEFQESNLPQKEWCTKKNVSYTKFKYWKQKFYKEIKETPVKTSTIENKESNWISIKTEEITEFEESHIKLTIGKVNIETTPNFNEKHLEKLIKVISRL